MGWIREWLKRRGTAAGRDPLQYVQRDLSMFREASFLRSDVVLPGPHELYRRYASLMYFIGAVRYTTVQHRLKEDEFVRIAADYLEHLGYTRAEIESALYDIAYRSFKPRGHEAFDEGVETFRLWQMGKDIDAPMRLAELLKQW